MSFWIAETSDVSGEQNVAGKKLYSMLIVGTVLMAGLLTLVANSRAQAPLDTSSAPPAIQQMFRPDDPVVAQAREEFADERKADAADFAASEDERAESRNEFSGLSNDEAISLARSTFPELLRGSPESVPDVELPRGMKLGRFTSETTARLLTADGQPTGKLLVSNLPLTADLRSQESLDLSLEKQGDTFEPESPRVDVSLPVQADDPVTLPDHDISFEPVNADDVQGVVKSGRVLYPEVDTDTDYIVQATDLGAESFWQLRSAKSPKTLTLQVDLPEDAQLIDRSALHNGTSAIINRADQTVATIPTVVAVDAAGRPVSVETKVEGDELVVDVDRDTSDVQFPILVDPAISTQWKDNDWYGCGAASVTGTWSVFNKNGNLFPVCFPGGMGIGTYQGQTYPTWNFLNFGYETPSDGTYISNVIWDAVTVNAPLNTQNYVGLYSPSCNGTWSDIRYLGGGTQSVGQDTHGSQCKNFVMMGMLYTANTVSPNTYMLNNRISIAIQDPTPPDPPQITGGTSGLTQIGEDKYFPWSSSAPWMDVAATDGQLGVQGVAVQKADGNLIWGPYFFDKDGKVTTSSSYVCTGMNAMKCSKTAASTVSYTGDTKNFHNLAEGDNVGKVITWDAAYNITPGRQVHVLRDSQPPASPTGVDISPPEPETQTATIAWADASDTDGTPLKWKVRYRRSGESWPAWSSVAEPEALLPNSTVGSYDVQVVAVDKANNESVPYSGALENIDFTRNSPFQDTLPDINHGLDEQENGVTDFDTRTTNLPGTPKCDFTAKARYSKFFVHTTKTPAVSWSFTVKQSHVDFMLYSDPAAFLQFFMTTEVNGTFATSSNKQTYPDYDFHGSIPHHYGPTSNKRTLHTNDFVHFDGVIKGLYDKLGTPTTVHYHVSENCKV